MPPRDSHPTGDFGELADSWRRPSGIYIVAPLEGLLAERVHAIQQRYDPKLAASMAPHLTLVGSSGLGPIDGRTSLEALRAVLEPIARDTPPLSLAVGAPMRFMQTDVVVLPLDPHGVLRQLHDRIGASGLRFAQPRFTFTPHLTLSFHRELTSESRRALLSFRAMEPARFSRLVCSLTDDPRAPRQVLELELSGGVRASA